MRQRYDRTIAALGFALFASAASFFPANAEENPEPRRPCSETFATFVGSWHLVTVENFALNGERAEPYGPAPQGLLMIDPQGHYSVQIFRPDRPRFAAQDKNEGTPAEYAAAIRGSNAHFGRLEIDAERCQLLFRIEQATFPNWEGTQQRRRYRLHGETLEYQVPEATQGRSTAGRVVWRRLP